MNKVERYLARAGMTVAHVAALLKLSRSAIHNKLAGRRSWTHSDLETLLPALAHRLKRPVTADQLGLAAVGESGPRYVARSGPRYVARRRAS